MIKLLPRNIFRFFVLVLLQVLVFNNIQIGGWGIVPHFYILFIILMPFETPGWAILLAGFVLGFTVDIFANTFGLHAAATTLAAFARPLALNVLAPREGYEAGTLPRVLHYKLPWFLKYATIVVTVHQLWYYILETFTFAHFGRTFLIIIFSSALSLLLIALSQFFIYRK